MPREPDGGIRCRCALVRPTQKMGLRIAPISVGDQACCIRERRRLELQTSVVKVAHHQVDEGAKRIAVENGVMIRQTPNGVLARRRLEPDAATQSHRLCAGKSEATFPIDETKILNPFFELGCRVLAQRDDVP